MTAFILTLVIAGQSFGPVMAYPTSDACQTAGQAKIATFMNNLPSGSPQFFCTENDNLTVSVPDGGLKLDANGDWVTP